MKKSLLGISLLSILTLTACKQDTILDMQLSAIINEKGLTGDPMAGKNLPNITEPKPQLGMRLFFNKALSGDYNSACVTCHHPFLGFGDNLSLPIGAGAAIPDMLGELRQPGFGPNEIDNGPNTERNAPTIFNIAGYNFHIAHDGRIEGLDRATSQNGLNSRIRTPDVPNGEEDPLSGETLPAAQSRFPIASIPEMLGFNLAVRFDLDGNTKTMIPTENQNVREYLASRFGGYGEGAGELPNPEYWLTQFKVVYNDPDGTPDNQIITEQRIADAIGEYERSVVLTESPWRRYIEGNRKAISLSAKRGALLFFNDTKSGGANCASCHSGDFFTDEKFHNIAMPQIGRGKSDGTFGFSPDGTKGTGDFGRFRETGLKDDKYAFRTSELTNIEVTGPYGHDGAFQTLEGIIRHHLNARKSVNSYNVGQLNQTLIQSDYIYENTKPALDKLIADRKAGKDVLQNVNLTDKQVKDLVNFLKTLTDPCAKSESCLAQWTPPLSEDPNGLQLDPQF